MKIFIATLLFLSLLVPCRAADDYERHVKNLAAGTPEKDIEASLRALRAAGAAAFPTLIAHFTDKTLAEPKFFQREMVEIVNDRIVGFYAPKVGDACFDILQGQIEGNWPKLYRVHYVLSPTNAKQWLDAHKGLTIPQLQRASREESLRNAEAALAKDPSAKYLQDEIAFLKKEIEALKTR
jgi:hypothetical protein